MGGTHHYDMSRRSFASGSRGGQNLKMMQESNGRDEFQINQSTRFAWGPDDRLSTAMRFGDDVRNLEINVSNMSVRFIGSRYFLPEEIQVSSVKFDHLESSNRVTF